MLFIGIVVMSRHIICCITTGGLAVDAVNDILYFSYRDGSKYQIAELPIGKSTFTNIETTKNEIGELLVMRS